MNSSTPEHRRNILLNGAQWHDGSRIALCGVRKFLKSCERVVISQVEYFLMRGNDIKVESRNPIEEDSIGCKPHSMLRSVVQDLLDCCGCFCHCRLLLFLLFLFWNIALFFCCFSYEET